MPNRHSRLGKMTRRESYTGKLIVFEGPDEVGKSSVGAAVAARLEARGEPCVLLSFPGREPGTLGKLVYDIHHNPEDFNIVEMSAASMQALHIAAHLDTIQRRIAPTLRSGRHVLLDRYWWSTWVYGVVAGIDRRVLHRMIDVERAQWEPIRPMLAVLLRRAAPLVPVSDINHWQALILEYDRVAQRERESHAVEVVQNDGLLEATVTAV